ncbi:microsomal signal peptidase 23 kD subunit [Entamoeba marina]
MYNTLERMYNIAYYAAQCLGVAVVCLYFTSLVLYVPPTTDVAYNSHIEVNTYRKVDMDKFTFDVDVDFTPSFNWNTKMIFVWVTASFSTNKIPLNNATIWDTMIRNKKNAHLVLKNEPMEYPLVDFSKDLRGKDVTLTVEWMVIPWTGETKVERGSTTTFTIPNE